MSKSPVVLTNRDGSSITVHLQGAHLTSWRTASGEEMLYTSPEAVYESGVPIRGGVPIIFPQFSNMGPLPPHGFARVSEWRVKSTADGVATFVFEVPLDNLWGRGAFPSAVAMAPIKKTNSVVELLYTITFNNQHLELGIEISNKDPTLVAEFAFAFHTYFALGDVGQTIVNGVNLTSYIDNRDPRRTLLPPKRLWTINGEIDNTYPRQNCAVLLLDMSKKRTIHISGVNLPDVVVWNPFVEKGKQMKDLPEDGYKKFVCVEHGRIEKHVMLEPASVWRASQRVSVLRGSNI
ncbi:putative Aldose 1 epimerase [Trypanosoma vivax]|uniref:glucose-6-phosphate 1-epimerase n=1 Tax=Trypanosoma vivax (strain Y486) TaxID=1055687 RepID=G0TU06_TRYVY|nr:hypothetical protein TRVL_05162 [Trypanosoma vivax]KAH8614274.1 putative Aldose 1 epimerase [Trypanosoma vivax]CCC47439.1 conserved hypothetical protein [Trypanosoma vivax Y486]